MTFTKENYITHLNETQLRWRADAYCLPYHGNVPADAWGASTEDDMKALGRTICARQCDVQKECLIHALVTGEPWHVWGGASEGQRKNLYKKLLVAYAKKDPSTLRQFEDVTSRVVEVEFLEQGRVRRKPRGTQVLAQASP